LFNAAFDASLIDLVLSLQEAIHPESMALATCDRGLAMAWAMLEPRNPRLTPAGLAYSVTLDHVFAERMPMPMREALLARAAG